MYCELHKQTECDAHLVNDEHVPATGHSTNPDWSGYDLCDECITEYDNRQPVGLVPFPRFTCTRCGHQWLPRSENKPKFCPRCNSPYWDKPRQTPKAG